MRVVVIDGPDGIDVTWYTDDTGETLYVALSPALDDVTRQRYIALAKREHGLDERRRRLIPLLLPAGGHHGGVKQVALGGVAVTAATAVVAAVIIPAVLDSNKNAIQRHPQAAAPPTSSAPHRGGPSDSQPPKTAPSAPPDARPNGMPPPETSPTRTLTTAPGRVTDDALPSLPAKPPIISKPPVSLPTKPPRAVTRRHVTVRVDLGGTPLLRLRLNLPGPRRPVVPSPHVDP